MGHSSNSLLMDEYLKVIFKELYCNDGMVVMGHGLGVDRLFCKFLQYYAEKSEQHKKPLVFCLNVNNLETAFTDLMLSDGVRPDHMPKVGKFSLIAFLILQFFGRQLITR